MLATRLPVARDADQRRLLESIERDALLRCTLPEAKSQLSYKDRDTLLVGGVFGDAREGGPAAVRRGCPSRAGVCGQARGG